MNQINGYTTSQELKEERALIKVTNSKAQPVFWMATKDAKERVETVGGTWKKRAFNPNGVNRWSKHRCDAGNDVDQMHFEITYMPNTDQKIIESMARNLDKESLSYTVYK